MANEKRLIELDHALQAVAEQYTTDTTERELNMFCDIRQRLRTLPTVYAVEVVHGLWVTDEKGVTYCGRCKVIDDFASVHNYCPNCGAIMDGRSNVPRTDGDGNG